MRQGMKRWPRLMLAATAAIGLAACQSSQQTRSQAPAPAKPLQPVADARAAKPVAPPKPIRSGPIRIALLAPLSGDYADAGRELANGAAMAILAPGSDAEILAFDTKADPNGAKAAVADAALARADIVIGPLFGANAKAIAPDLEVAGLTALAFSNDGSVAGPRVSVMGRAVEAEAARIVRHAAESGARVVAVFGRNDVAGEAAAAQAAREAAAIDGFQIQRALYQPGEDYTAVAKSVEQLVTGGDDGGRAANAGRLKTQLDASADPGATLAELATSVGGTEGATFSGLAAFYDGEIARGAPRPEAVNAVIGRYMTAGGPAGRPDAVLLTVGGAELSTIAPMFQLYDADVLGVRLLGMSGWSAMDPARARELHGGRFAAAPFNEAFELEYERLFGVYPTELASVAYDAVKVALAATDRAVARPAPEGAPAAAGRVAGAHGSVRVSEGGLALRPLEVLEMGPLGFTPVEQPRIVDPAAPPPPAVVLTPPATAGAGS